jgi:hypothetical protein
MNTHGLFLLREHPAGFSMKRLLVYTTTLIALETNLESWATIRELLNKERRTALGVPS